VTQTTSPSDSNY